MFLVGDAVVHPLRGAGVVEGVSELRQSDGVKEYYNIRMLGRTKTSLMIPVKKVEDSGLRPAISQTNLEEIWTILESDPNDLPSNHKQRYKVLHELLQTGDVFSVAEAVRDIEWRRLNEDGLTTNGSRIYQKGLKLLAGEIAVSQGISITDAEEQVKACLQESLTES